MVTMPLPLQGLSSPHKYIATQGNESQASCEDVLPATASCHAFFLPPLPSSIPSLSGPLPETVVDFWRLVWQEKVPTIAMLTGLHEQGSKKCERYWPEYGTAEYGPYSVTLAEQQVLADYTFSTLELQFNAVSVSAGSSAWEV